VNVADDRSFHAVVEPESNKCEKLPICLAPDEKRNDKPYAAMRSVKLRLFHSTLAGTLRLNWQFTTAVMRGQAFGRAISESGRRKRNHCEMCNVQMHFSNESDRPCEPYDMMERPCGF
jgi:hypothetical protein